MRMDTETISYVLEGHELQNDVQTMIQVFLANRHYIRTDTVTDAAWHFPDRYEGCPCQ